MPSLTYTVHVIFFIICIHNKLLRLTREYVPIPCSLRSGRQPAAVHPVLPAAAGGRGEAAQDDPPGAAVSGRVAGRTPGARAGGRGSPLRSGQ